MAGARCLLRVEINARKMQERLSMQTSLFCSCCIVIFRIVVGETRNEIAVLRYALTNSVGNYSMLDGREKHFIRSWLRESRLRLENQMLELHPGGGMS
jgi:hypothetical protein